MHSEQAAAWGPPTNISLSYSYVLSPRPYANSDLSNLGRCELGLCGELNTDPYARPSHWQQTHDIGPYLLLLLSSFLIVFVIRKSSPLPTALKSDTYMSKGTGQDHEGEDDTVIHAMGQGIPSLRSEALNKLNIIKEWTNPSLSEDLRKAEQELTQLLTLLNTLVDEETKTFLNRFDTFCSNAVRKCPDDLQLLTIFSRKNVFLDKVARWGKSTHQGLSENVAKKKSHASCSETDKTEGLSNQLSNTVKKVQQQLITPNVELILVKKFENINMSQREYRTIPKPFYGLSEEPLGQHAMATVSIATQSVAVHAVKTIHSFSGGNTESPPHVWMNQVRHYVKDKSSENPYLAKLFGYNRCGERFDLIYHGSLIPFEEQLRKLTNIQPLEKVELISKTNRKLKSACSYFTDQLNLRVHRPTHLYWFLITMLQYNKAENEMILCGDFTQWYTEDIVDRSRDIARLRNPVIFAGSGITTDSKDDSTYPHFSRARDLCRDLPKEQRRTAILNFYDALTHICIPTKFFCIPFFMRGIHVDPRIQKPCNQHWCRPRVDIWSKVAQHFIELPNFDTIEVPRYDPDSEFHNTHPAELATDNPRYLRILQSIPPHSQDTISQNYNTDPTPLGLTPTSLIWLSQAGRIFSSSQFQKSGLQKRDIMYIKTRALNSAFMLDPPSAEDIPVDLSLQLDSFPPHMDMNGIHIGPTRWKTVDPQHRSHMCESSWTMKKYFYCTAEGLCWDDDTYEAIDEFHRSLGMDPYSGEMAELLGFPLLDIDDLLHTAGWTCSHPTIQDSLVRHTLTPLDIEVSWDLPIRSPSSIDTDGTSEVNIKMKQWYDENGTFCEEDLHYSPPPTSYAKLTSYWAIILIQLLSKYLIGWVM